MMALQVPYVCGPLTDLDPAIMEVTKRFYEQIGDACKTVLGVRAFVPHEHYDPIKAAHFTPAEVDKAERTQVCSRTSVLIVCPISPSWGGGIEVEMARSCGVTAVLLCERLKLENRKISRLLLGNPAVRKVIAYDSYDEAIAKLMEWIPPYHIASNEAA